MGSEPVIFIIVCMIVLHFLLFNIFVGLNIINIQEANSDYYEEIHAEKESILARKKEQILRRQFEDVRKLKEKQFGLDDENQTFKEVCHLSVTL